MDAERNACIGVLRSLATSRRDTSLHDLIRDYGETEGGHIPYKKFGYSRLEDFLNSSGQFSLTAYGTVRVRATEASSHILKLVAEQKNVTKKKKFAPHYAAPPPRPRSVGDQRSGAGASPSHLQPSLYSRAIQQLKVRSPVKTNASNAAAQRMHQQPNTSSNHSNNNNGYNQQQGGGGGYQHYTKQSYCGHIAAAKSTSTSPLPQLVEKPSYVVTFNNGEAVMRPNNALAQRQSSIESNSSSGTARKGGSTEGASPPPQQQQQQHQPQQQHQHQQQQQQQQQQQHQQQQHQQQQQPRAITKSSSNGTGAAGVTDLRQKLSNPPQQQLQHATTNDGANVVDLRQRLNRKRGDELPVAASGGAETVASYVDLRQRLSKKPGDEPAMTPALAKAPEENATQRLNKGEPTNSKIVDMLRQRLKPQAMQEQQHLQHQSQPQPFQEQSPPPSQSAASSECGSTQSSLSSRLQSRLKITAQPEPTVVQPLKVATSSPPNTNTTYTTTAGVQQQQQLPSPSAMDGAVRSTLNNRLMRKAESATQPLTQMQMPAPPPQVAAPEQPLNFYSPTFTPQHAPPQPADNITTLAIYCTNKSHAVPSYDILKMPKTNRLQCRLMINGITYSSYPLDFESVREAKLYTAGEALRRLRELDVEEQYPLCMDLDAELVLKVYDCLKQSPYGMFERNIPEQFQKTYRQTLPVHWTTLIVMAEHAQLFSIAESVQGNIIHALTASDLQQQQQQQQPPTQTNQHQQPSPRQQPSPPVQPQSYQQQQQQQPQPPQPQQSRPVGAVAAGTPATNYEHMDRLVLPWSEKYWNLFITNPRSTVDVWARLIGADYSDRMDNLIVDIELDLMQSRQRPAQLLVGHIYLVVVSECTYRVRIARNDFEARRCLCFYVDVGDEEWVAMDEIYVCKPQFLRFPAQAICLSLFGLEDCAENPIAPQHLVEQLLNKTLIGDVASRREDYEQQEASADVAAKVVVALYDTSSEEDVQLNSLILERICAHSQPPQLDLTGVTNVVISHVTDGGDVYCQPLTMTGGIHYVQKLIHHITRFGFNPDHHRLDANALEASGGGAGGRLVLLVQDESDGKWYRATVLQRAAERSQVFYVDHGMTRTVATAKMYRLDSMCQVLHSYPFQAIVCKLHDVPRLSAAQLASLRGYLRPGVQAMVKIRGLQQKVPVVKIFIRQADGPLFTVNDVILFEQECESSNEDGAASPTGVVWNAADVMPKLTVSSRPPSANGQHVVQLKQQQPMQPLQPLAKCPTPAVGERFEVHVTMASNPHNFKVRPYRQLPQFQSLMIELQAYCNRTPDYVPDDQICIEQAYACQQTDKVWYRVVVQNVISNSMFLICYCDYGDIVVINSDRLKVLPASFRQLPALAISARLSGVKPVNRDWETDDCLRFQNMTVDKKFVSRIDNILRSGPAAGDEAILELTLIDVSTATDINVNQLLVVEERAVPMAAPAV